MMKTTFKLLHLLSCLLLCTPNTPFASTPNPRRNLKNGSNFCYATSALQAYADYLAYIFSSNQYPYQAPIKENDPPKLKDQKAAYQEIRKALDYIKKKPNTKHPDLHTLLTLLNRYDPDLKYKKGGFSSSHPVFSSLCSFFEITVHRRKCIRQAITPSQREQATLKINTDYSMLKHSLCEVIHPSHNSEAISTTDVIIDPFKCLLAYLYAEALQTVYPNTPPIPLVTESCITPLCKSITTYLLDNKLTSGAGQGKTMVESLALDIDKALNIFMGVN
ncbi:MAG: hypothetical protein AAF380_01420 [Bacteroidota bacterium]